jgi:hypothetical protein
MFFCSSSVMATPGFPYLFPSTILISSSVKPYNLYTNWPITHRSCQAALQHQQQRPMDVSPTGYSSFDNRFSISIT